MNNDDKVFFSLIQSLRFIAFLTILADHSKVMVGLGEYGVEIFLVLSGFLLQYRYQKKNIALDFRESFQFSLKKIKKLYLLHLIMLVMALVLEMYLNANLNLIGYLSQNSKKIVMNIFLLQIWSINKSVYFAYNGVVWYLSLMFFIYAMFPFLYRIVKKQELRTNIIIIVGCIVLEVLVFILVNINFFNWSHEFVDWFTYVFVFFRMLDFVAGMCLGSVFLHSELNETKAMMCVLVLAVNIIACTLSHTLFYKENAPYIGNTPFFLLVVVPLIWLFAKEPKMLKKLFGNKIFVFLGGRTPYYFLIHNVFLGYIRTLFNVISPEFNRPWLLFIVSLAGTIICSEIYTRLVGKR